MSFPRKIYEFLKMASIAHAKWDYEVSMSIIKNRKKLLIPGIILGISFLQAADMIGSKTAYAPAQYSNMIFMVSIAVGLAAGLITGCIGAGERKKFIKFLIPHSLCCGDSLNPPCKGGLGD
jgi:uncharacterized protein